MSPLSLILESSLFKIKLYISYTWKYLQFQFVVCMFFWLTQQHNNYKIQYCYCNYCNNIIFRYSTNFNHFIGWWFNCTVYVLHMVFRFSRSLQAVVAVHMACLRLNIFYLIFFVIYFADIIVKINNCTSVYINYSYLSSCHK